MTEHKEASSSRRTFLQTGAAIALGTAALSSKAKAQDGSNEKSEGIPITIAGYPYERVRAIEDGSVKIAGCNVTFESSSIGKMNQHVFSGPGTRDVTEVGLIPFLLAFCNGEFRDYEALPIFVLKVFRHKSIFIRTDRGITKPEDLRGRKVATVGYSSSGLTWIRGILKDEYGVSPEEIQWISTSKDSAATQTGGVSKWEKILPANVSITNAPIGRDESDLLLDGDVDAVFHPAEPQAYVDRHPLVDRLFCDHRKVEREYFAKTKIFPIMHLVAIRRELAEAKPWLRKAVFEAYSQAKQLDYAEMRRIRWAYSALPWYGQEFNETRELMGENFYSYGIKENRDALGAAFRYLHDQGLANRRLKIEELFHSSTLDLKDEPA